MGTSELTAIMIGLVRLSLTLSALLAGVNGRNHLVVQERTRIVGGEEVEPHSIPWQVYLGDVNCGGTIICPRFVMTAAHCIDQKVAKEVYVGLHNVKDDLTEDRLHGVKKIYKHPKYEVMPGGVNYDFAILELTNPINMSSDAKATFLPNGKEKYNRKSLFLTSGWGLTSFGGDPSDALLSVTVPWVPRGVCQDAYEKLSLKVTPQMMCAGDVENGKIDACTGDSGGPLTWLDPKTDQVKLCGVVSFGSGCAEPHLPGVYADVIDQLDWIKAVTKNCNEKTCQSEENCMRKKDLVPSIIKRFETITPH